MESEPLKIKLVVPTPPPRQACSKAVALIGLSVWVTALFTVSYYCFENEFNIFRSSLLKSIRVALDFDGDGESLLTAMHHTESHSSVYQEPDTCASRFDEGCSDSSLQNEQATPTESLNEPKEFLNAEAESTKALKGQKKSEKSRELKYESKISLKAEDKSNEAALNLESLESVKESKEPANFADEPRELLETIDEDKYTSTIIPVSKELEETVPEDNEHKPDLDNIKFTRMKNIGGNIKLRTSTIMKSLSKPSAPKDTDDSLKSQEIPTTPEEQIENLLWTVETLESEAVSSNGNKLHSEVDTDPAYEELEDQDEGTLPTEGVYNSGEIRSAAMAFCIDAGSFEGSELSLYICHGGGGNQKWMYNGQNEIKKDNWCADYFGGPSILLFKCHGKLGNQMWNYNSTKQTFYHPYSNTCLTLLDESKVAMQACEEEKEAQKWIWKDDESLMESESIA